MSLASWKKEFYRKPADQVSKRNALQHSLRKWVGLLHENREKHGVQLHLAILHDSREEELDINSDSCALCHCVDSHCVMCPLISCTKEYRELRYHGRPTPMIYLIKKAINKRRKVK